MWSMFSKTGVLGHNLLLTKQVQNQQSKVAVLVKGTLNNTL